MSVPRPQPPGAGGPVPLRPGRRRLRSVLAEAHLALLLLLYAGVTGMLGLRGGRGLLRLLAGPGELDARAPAPSAADRARARALRTAVEARADRLPGRPACIPRALALATRLRQQGLPAELRLGVRRVGAGLVAHAWVESGGVALEPSEAWTTLAPREAWTTLAPREAWTTLAPRRSPRAHGARP